MRNLFLYICLLFVFQKLHCQDLPCGTAIPEHDILDSVEHLETKSSSTLYDMRYFKINVHIIRKSDGTGGVDEGISDFIKTLLDQLNSYYNNAFVHFYTCTPIEYIDDDSLYYNFRNNVNETTLINNHNNTYGINLYYTNKVFMLNEYGYDSVCGYAHYPPSSYQYTQQYNFIIIQNNCFYLSTVHEIGHFFNLYHTHDCPNGNCELVNGSNCSTAGDKCCDTPADPGLNNINVSGDCVYNGTATDINGDSYDPDPTNIMSYSRKECRTTLTPNQYGRVSATSRTLQRIPFNHQTRISNTDINYYMEIEDDNVFVDNVIFSADTVYINACNQVVLEQNVEVPLGHVVIIQQ